MKKKRNLSIIVRDEYGDENELVVDGDKWLWTRYKTAYLFDVPIPFSDREKAIDCVLSNVEEWSKEVRNED